MTNGGVNGFPSRADAGIPASKLAAPMGWGFYASGFYYFTSNPYLPGVSAALGVGTCRLGPWFLPNRVALSKIGAEITSGGDSGSKLRLGIYADNGSGYPGNLVLDAGTIAGDSATVQEISINQMLDPGLYWVGGVVQVVSVTQPTVRTSAGIPLVPMPVSTTTPSAGLSVIFCSQASVTGALPGVFWSTLNVGQLGPRVFVKVA